MNARKNGGRSSLITKTLYVLAVLLLASDAGGLLRDIEAGILIPVEAAGLLIFLFVEMRTWGRMEEQDT